MFSQKKKEFQEGLVMIALFTMLAVGCIVAFCQAVDGSEKITCSKVEVKKIHGTSVKVANTDKICIPRI
jgi:hypothetical protein